MIKRIVIYSLMSMGVIGGEWFSISYFHDKWLNDKVCYSYQYDTALRIAKEYEPMGQFLVSAMADNTLTEGELRKMKAYEEQELLKISKEKVRQFVNEKPHSSSL